MAATGFFKNDSAPEALAGIVGELFVYKNDSPVNRSRDREDWETYVQLRLEGRPQTNFLSVPEIIEERSLLLGERAMGPRRDDRHAEGIALAKGAGYVILMRVALTRLFKSYAFNGAPDEETNAYPGIVNAPILQSMTGPASRFISACGK